MLLYIILITCASLVYYFLGKDYRKYGHIPGPRKLPLVGNITQFNRRDHQGNVIPMAHVVTSLAKKYGEVMWINVGFTNMIILSGYSSIHEALVEKGADFADRPITNRMLIMREENGMFGMGHTPTCRVIRNIYHKALKVYSGGTEYMKRIIHESLQDLEDRLVEENGQGVVVKEIFMGAFANTMYIMLFGHQMDRNGTAYASLLELEDCLLKAIAMTPGGFLVDNFAVMKHFCSDVMNNLNHFISMRDGFWLDKIKEHKEQWDLETERCLLDTLLKEQKTRAETRAEVQLSDDHILMALSNGFNGGFTSSTSILTGVLLLCLHDRGIQDKLYEDVCNVVGSTGQVSVKHKSQLHYTRAVIFEALRYFSLAPLGVLHKTTKDTSVCGYDIPVNTTVAMNQWALHHDSQVWEDPWTFIPERYLDLEGSLVPSDHITRKRLMAFGAGERRCVGKYFALNRLCLFVSTLVQRFRFEVADQEPLPSHDPRTWELHFILQAPYFKANFIPRA